MTFDCKKGFIGEEVYIPIKLKNVGGVGRFFIMSEIDWFSMNILDITDKNILKLPCFTLWPAYFLLKGQEEITFHMHFSPECYGIHQLRKVRPSERDIDERANYYINLSSNTTDGIEQCIIAVKNMSEINMHFRWKKRNIQTDKEMINEENYFPFELLHIKPDRGVFAPMSVHNFTITAEYKDLRPNYYLAVLQLYVEDIPLEAIPENTDLEVEECTTKRRKCATSVDIWVDDVEVWLHYLMGTESETCVVFNAELINNYRFPLLEDELFSHYDLMNLRQFESLWQEHIISMGIIRPTKILYIGIEETYILILRNLASNTLNYSWGEVNGLDSTMMELCVCPEKGEVLAGNTQRMKITITPIKEGIVQSLFIPCFVGDSRKIIMLGIECAIESLYVTFYFPLDDEMPVELKNNFIKVEWRADSFQLAFDLAGKSKKHMKILDVYIMREERELMNTNLDQGEILKDAAAGPSMEEVTAMESGEQSSTTIRTSEIIQMSNVITENENNSHDVASFGNIVPFCKRYLPSVPQPAVIEFLNLPLRKAETLYKIKQPGSGVVIYVAPLNSDIDSFSAIPVDIYVFADTWGIYVDELEINITGLPLYSIGICVQVFGLPISFSISDRNEFNIPVIKYGIEAVGTRLHRRKVLLTNTSVVPIVIDWHTFLVTPAVETKPFNVAFDLCTPFTDKLASRLKASKQKNESELHLEEHANFPLSKNLDTCDSFEISNITDITVPSSYMYKDNFYARQIGTYLSSIELDVTADIIKPQLDFNISKSDRTFICYANEVMQSRRKRLEKPGQLVETLEIVTDIPHNTEECQLYGEGTLDEKYH
ncbi:hypothetical protein WN48_07718, partial [Eufriesea mexicana]